MPFIRWIEEDEATGELADTMQKWRNANPQRDKFPDIIHCFTSRPDVMKQVMEISYTLHFSQGHLDRRTKEMIATFVSGLNQCPY
jgi:Tat protein secretion system quality control protein TatD with DNase activity